MAVRLNSAAMAYYEFPYGNFKKVFRSGLIAAEQRAKHEEIKAAARKLITMIN